MPDERPWGLTKRELQCVQLLAKNGGLYKLIASELAISIRTVEVYLATARKKAGVGNTMALAIAYDRLMRPTVVRHKL